MLRENPESKQSTFMTDKGIRPESFNDKALNSVLKFQRAGAFGEPTSISEDER